MTRLTIVIAAGIMSATPLWSEGFDRNDYAKIFAAHENDAIPVKPGVRSVTLADRIEIQEITRGRTVRYQGIDNSEAGAVLFFLSVWWMMAMAAENCPDAFGAVALEQLGHDLDRLSAFVGANASPPVDAAAYRRTLDAMIAEAAPYFGTFEKQKGLLNGIERFVVTLAEAPLDPVLATPRLPVMTSCWEGL